MMLEAGLTFSSDFFYFLNEGKAELMPIWMASTTKEAQDNDQGKVSHENQPDQANTQVWPTVPTKCTSVRLFLASFRHKEDDANETSNNGTLDQTCQIWVHSSDCPNNFWVDMKLQDG